MNCEEVIDLFLAQKENEDAAAKAVIENHLKSCSDCRRKIEEMDFLLAAIESQPQPQPPAELSERFAAFMKNQQSDRVQVTIVRTISKQLWIAAGLIIIVGLAILFVLINQKTTQQPLYLNWYRSLVRLKVLFQMFLHLFAFRRSHRSILCPATRNY